MKPVQSKLGLRLNSHRVRTKKSVFTYFVTYRICKRLLARDVVPRAETVKAIRGFKNGIDPNMIHVSRVYPPGPKGFVDGRLLSPDEVQWTRFTEYVDRKVQRLPEYQRRIIQLRFLAAEPLPSDFQVHDTLGRSWNVYCEEKAQALKTLARQFEAIEPEE